MSLVATEAELFLFDTHVHLAPLEDADLLKPSFRFLVDLEAYDTFYATGSPLELGDSTLRPFRSTEISQNYFWRNFGKRLRPLGPWLRHLPLIYECAKEVEFVLDEPPLRAKVLPQILLWPWGWSCNLWCCLEGTLDAETLSHLVRRQQSSNTEPGTFVVAGERFKCNRVFQEISDELRQHLFSDATEARDALTEKRHFVLSLPEIQGEARPYEWSPSVGLVRLKTSDRAELHTVLLGRTVTVQEVVERERAEPKPFLLTSFVGISFGLTDFESGTVLYLPRLIARGEEKNRLAKYCLAANIGSCSQTALALAGFLENVDETDNAKIRSLAQSAQGNLERIAKHGGNNFSKGFVRRNTRVSKFLSKQLLENLG